MQATADSSQFAFSSSTQAGELSQRITELGEWFHNLDLHGVKTAPNHFLGDFPNVKWQLIRPEIPARLAGAPVLAIGCTGGSYSFEIKRRAARRVLGIDVRDGYWNR